MLIMQLFINLKLVKVDEQFLLRNKTVSLRLHPSRNPYIVCNFLPHLWSE